MRGMRTPNAAGIAILVGVAVLVLNLALWVLYRDSRRSLQAELSRRLETVAGVLAHTLDPELVDRARGGPADFLVDAADSMLASSAYDSLREVLRDIADDTELANVRLYDADGIAFFDLSAPGRAGAEREVLDPAGVLAALAGTTGHSELYQSGSEYLMAGYAPVRDATAMPVAAVAVEADARFFASLRQLRFAMAASGLLSVLVLAGLGLTFARMQTSLRRTEAALQRAETLAAMGRMTASIAHEIRNPLGIMKATVARLRKRYENPEQPDERFGYIDGEVDRLNAILTGYLQFARDEPPRLETLDLVPLVERSLRSLAPELDGAAVRLETRLPAACAVQADAQRLQQVILNVVLNAVQAQPGGGALRVELTPAEGRVRLAFEDRGPGFDPAVRNRLFEPFVSSKEQGSGLGLAAARRIVEQHGGTIAAGDAADGGARIEIELPLAAGPPGPKASATGG